MIGQLFLYRDEDDWLLDSENKHEPQNGDVCMSLGADEFGYHSWAVLRKNDKDAWKVSFQFFSEPLMLRIGELSLQKLHHLLAGYTLRHIEFKKETVH